MIRRLLRSLSYLCGHRPERKSAIKYYCIDMDDGETIMDSVWRDREYNFFASPSQSISPYNIPDSIGDM